MPRTSPSLALFALALCWAVPARAQYSDQPQSVAEAARVARAKHDHIATDASAPAPHGPFSSLQLLAWQIAGVPSPELLSNLAAYGIAFAPDDAHLNSLKDAQLAPEILGALRSAPAHPDPAVSADLPQPLIAASQAFNGKDYAAARHALEPLVQQAPNADLFAALGNLDALCKDAPASRSAFEHAVQSDPSFLYAHVRLAAIYYKLEDASLTSAEARKALQLQPGNAEARRYLSLSLSMKLLGGGSGGANAGGEDIADLQNSEGMNQEAKDLNNKGVQAEDEGDYKAAETAWNGAIALEPNAAVLYYNRANLYVKWGGHNILAENDFQKAKALAPRNLAVRQNYGHYLCEAHAFGRAVTEFQEILKLDPDWNMARPCLYISLFYMNRKPEANRVLREYREWNIAHGVPDDSADIAIGEPRIDDPGHTSL